MKFLKPTLGRCFFGRFEFGEEAVSVLKNFVVKEKISSGVFNIIGAVKKVRLGFYDQSEKNYSEKEFSETLEISSCSGNIAWMNNEPVIHAHGLFSRKNGSTLGGHLYSMEVFAGEYFLQEFNEKVNRRFDSQTGLNLLDFKLLRGLNNPVSGVWNLVFHGFQTPLAGIFKTVSRF